MNENDLMQKVQKLQTDGALTADELKQLKAGLEAQKKLPWLLVAAISLSVIVSISSYQRRNATRGDQLPAGFTRLSTSDGVTLEYRWPSGAPSKAVHLFIREGQLEFRPSGSLGAKPGLIYQVPKDGSADGPR